MVGRERCLVLTLDDFVADSEAQYRRLMDFAGLEPVAGMDFSPQRSGYAVRSHSLQRLLKRPPNRIREYLAGKHFRKRVHDLDKPEKKASHKAIWSLRRRLLKANRLTAPPKPMPLAVQREIALHYREEVEHAGRLIGRDLSHWLQPKPARLLQGADSAVSGYRAAYASHS